MMDVEHGYDVTLAHAFILIQMSDGNNSRAKLQKKRKRYRITRPSIRSETEYLLTCKSLTTNMGKWTRVCVCVCVCDCNCIWQAK